MKKKLDLQNYPLAYENYAKLLMNLGEKEKAYHFLKEEALPRYERNPLLLEIWKNLQDR